MPALDLAYVRAQFPAFAEPSLRDSIFLENAGGSYVCAPVLARQAEYGRRLRLQPYYPYPASQEAGRWMDEAYVRLAAYLNVGADEIHFGPSTSQNSYVLAQAFGQWLKPGDEIIVTNQDHEANTGVWRRLARQGVTVREWAMNRDSGELELTTLDALLTPRTRLVAFTHCSNVLAHINPVAAITARVRAAGAISVVDGVAYAPHGLPDVQALGADIYLFSLYKTYGPHQGLMVVRKPVLDALPNEGHYFNGGYGRKRLVPAGPDHAQIAAAAGIADYLDGLDAHHGGGDATGRPERVRQLLRMAESAVAQPLLDYLAAKPSVRLLGPGAMTTRAATIAFIPQGIAPAQLAVALAGRGILAAAGHFYAVRLLEGLGLDPAHGVLRLSLLHYTSAADVARVIAALDELLA